MDALLELTTGGDPAVQPLVAAQEAEVMERYASAEPGPGLAADTPCLLARVEGRAVGCVALGRLDDTVGEVKRMYVDPSARGRRIGRRLLEGVEELAAGRGYRVLRLEAGTAQPEALRLYDGSGWTRIPCYGYWKDHASTICFEKRLGTRTAQAQAPG